ncbi:MAG: hypothetical protein ACXAB5_04565 [Candidatus Thorarchaeota archaeon]|jgi:hypothetical protein
MRRSLIPIILVACLIFSSPVFTSASENYEWVVRTGDRYDYRWTVENNMVVVFQENIYIIVEELAEILVDIDPSDVWTLSETGFNVSIFWSNGTALDVSTVEQPFEYNILPVGNWSQLIDAFSIEAGFLNDETIFAYEFYDLVLGTGEHREVKFQKSNGVLDLYHMHDFVDNQPVLRLDIQLLSSTPVTTTSTTTSNPTTTVSAQDPSMDLIVLAAGGGIVVLVIAIVAIRQRV